VSYTYVINPQDGQHIHILSQWNTQSAAMSEAFIHEITT